MTWWTSVIAETVSSIAAAITTAIVSAVGVMATFYLKQRTDVMKRQRLLDVVEEFVLWAAQDPIFDDATNEEKFLAVRDKAENWLESNHYSMSMSELRIIIEAAVRRSKGPKHD
jgi:hypothetical protein